MKKTCEVCENEYDAQRETSKYCSEACKQKRKRVTVSPDEVSVSKSVSVSQENDTVKHDITLLGRSYNDISSDDEFRLGDLVWGQIFTKDTLPYWMFDGEMERDSLPLTRGKTITSHEKRSKFRELMLTHDVRFGARDKEGNLLSA